MSTPNLTDFLFGILNSGSFNIKGSNVNFGMQTNANGFDNGRVDFYEMFTISFVIELMKLSFEEVIRHIWATILAYAFLYIILHIILFIFYIIIWVEKKINTPY